MSSRRPRSWIAVLCFATAVSVAADATHGQRVAKRSQRPDPTLLQTWRGVCERIRDGDPWGDIADAWQAALDAAGSAGLHPDFRSNLAAIRAAEHRAASLPKNAADATPEELVALLTESSVIHGQPGFGSLLAAPLHAHRESAAVTRVHWDRLAEEATQEHPDPAIRVLQGGRVMIPHLIGALSDTSATRCTYITDDRRPAILYLRGEMAMALLEAIARCRFYVSERGKRFVQHDDASREAAMALAERWWKATREMSPLDARSWLIARVPYDQAKPMIDLLVIQGETDRAVDALRDFLIRPDGEVQFQAARALAAVGDLSGLAAVVKQARTEQEISVDQVQWLVTQGGPREYRFLRDMLQRGLESDTASPSLSQNILKGAAFSRQSRMTIPLLALALDPDDSVPLAAGYTRDIQSALPAAPTRADLAALLIQDFTQRSFRYDPKARLEFRRKGIERVRAWWDREGRLLYGFENTRVRRGGGIR